MIQRRRTCVLSIEGNEFPKAFQKPILKERKNLMRTYLENLITEKGRSLEDNIELEGHIGLTWNMLIDFIVDAKEYHEQIRTMLVKIDFKNGDVFHYLTFLADGMVKACGY
jgi:hypothetical protein